LEITFGFPPTDHDTKIANYLWPPHVRQSCEPSTCETLSITLPVYRRGKVFARTYELVPDHTDRQSVS